MDKINNGYLTQYLQDNLMLVRTLVFKFHDAARLANEKVALDHPEVYLDESNPSTWKYYLNIAGRYHSTDTQMQVISIDTLETIDFTVENLKLHTATKKAYQYGTRQYYSLLNRYPTQQRLINGILNPADLQTAIDAQDGTIVAYRKDLVEDTEATLIERLSYFIQGQIARWYNQQFVMSAELYLSMFMAQVYAALLPKLLNLRMENCHTYEVHSFHVRMYLASHGRLDRYLPYLNLRQKLWLYRNIRYIQRNAGRSAQFRRLIEKLLTERGIPIAEYIVRQTDTFTSYLPGTMVEVKSLNGNSSNLTDNEQTLDTLYGKEKPLAVENDRYLTYEQQNDSLGFSQSPSDRVILKTLVSSMVDYTNAVPEPYEHVALRQWVAMACDGLYSAYVSFKDPKTSTTYSVSALDAFLYFYYVSLNQSGIEVTEIPTYLNIRERKRTKPSVEDLLKVADARFDLQEVAELILQDQPTLSEVYSVTAFKAVVDTLYSEAYWHWFLVSGTNNAYARAIVQEMTNQLYGDQLRTIPVGYPNIGAWLTAINLPEYDYSYDEATLLLKSIYEGATADYSDDTKKIGSVQKAMLSLLEQLSSYTIQLVREINDDAMVIINWPALRLDDPKTSQEITRQVPNGVITLSSREFVSATIAIVQDGEMLESKTTVTTQLENSVSYDAICDTNPVLTFSTEVRDTQNLAIQGVQVEGLDETLENEYGIPGISTYYQLSDVQQALLKSHY